MRRTAQGPGRLQRLCVASMASAVALLMSAQPASAQDTIGDLITANQGLVTTLGVMTTASSVVYVTQRLTDQAFDKIFGSAQRYMEHNVTALKLDVSVGGGETLDDMKTLYGLSEGEECEAFSRNVQTHRNALLAILSSPEITRESTIRFTELVLGPERFASIVR